MINLSELVPRERLMQGIDVSSRDEAIEYIELAQKLGLVVVKFEETIYSLGEETCSEIAFDAGMEWFADLKLHKTPNTTMKILRRLVELDHPPIGATMHITGDIETLQEAQEIAGEIPLFGVTVLTTDSGKERKDKFTQQAFRAIDAGLMGVTTSSFDLVVVNHYPELSSLLTLVTGLRMPGANAHEQANVDTHINAIVQGATLAVVAREVTLSENPTEALTNIIYRVEELK